MFLYHLQSEEEIPQAPKVDWYPPIQHDFVLEKPQGELESDEEEYVDMEDMTIKTRKRNESESDDELGMNLYINPGNDRIS